MVNIIKLFWKNLDFSELKKLIKKFLVMAELARKCEKNACKWLSVLLSCSLLIFVVAAWGGIYIFKFSSKIIFLTWLFAKNQSEFVKFSLISLRLMLCHQTIAHDLTQEWLPKFAKKSLQIIEFLSRYIWYKCFISKTRSSRIFFKY